MAESHPAQFVAGGFDAAAVTDWLLREARRTIGPGAFLGALCRRLVAAGLPLARASFHLRVLHPQLGAESFIWDAAHDTVSAHGFPAENISSPAFRDSPVRAIQDGAATIRRRLENAGDDAYPIVRELRAAGFTDYVVMPLAFGDDTVNAVSWATRRAGGFAVAAIDGLEDMMPILALLLEIAVRERIALTVLETYVGRAAGRRVLAGDIRRGSGQTLRTVIWSSDLRGFTALSETRPRDVLIEHLNTYFDCIVDPIHAHGGEVLKFMGDGVLAIFPCEGSDGECGAAKNALAAAREALDRLAALNRGDDRPRLETSLALHYGDVMYGNIGAADRLDFTVIGPAVNLVARIEALCHETGAPLLVSQAFAAVSGLDLPSVGVFQLRGVKRPQRLYTVPEFADPSRDAKH